MKYLDNARPLRALQDREDVCVGCSRRCTTPHGWWNPTEDCTLSSDM